jgi:hypothetical protein
MGTRAFVVSMVTQEDRGAIDKTAAARALFFIKLLLVFKIPNPPKNSQLKIK